jgi:hypothetical protein
MKNTPAILLAFVLAGLPPLRAATVVLPLTDLEPQYASQLCWAAADVIAVNSFFPGSCIAGATPGRTSQAVEAAYNKLGLKSLSAVSGADPTQLANMLLYCETNIQICNFAGLPILPGLTFQTSAAGTALTWAQAQQQIDAGHPFIFVWDYGMSVAGPDQPNGLHALVAIGYSDDNGEQDLVIWDPWPVPETLPSAVPACGPANVGVPAADLALDHEKTIPFSLYVNPESDMGIAAAHGSDQYNLAAAQIPAPPTNVQVDAAGPSTSKHHTWSHWAWRNSAANTPIPSGCWRNNRPPSCSPSNRRAG